MNQIKIAFPTNDRKNVEEHFGHAKEFAFATVKNKIVTSIEYKTPPPHVPGVIPVFVGDEGANVVITGNMGGKALNLFNELSIEVILGINGAIEGNLENYLQGNLESQGSECDHH